MAGLPVTEHFVQREAEMRQLEEFFQPDADVDGKRRKVFVVHGLGGMGKTQLCVEYVRRHKGDFTAIFWVDGSSKDALRQSLVNAAARVARNSPSPVGQPVPDARDAEGAIEGLHQWLSLEANTGWLLVLDNVDREWQGVGGRADSQAYDFKDFLPPADHGCVLITTRLGRLQRAKASLRMDAVGNDVAREMLEWRAGRTLSGGLPLALVQAGAYIRARNLTAEKYIAHYEKTWDKLMAYQDRYPLQEYAERSVLTTWKMSYEQVRTVEPRAAMLLDQWAFLHPAEMSYELIEAYNDNDNSKHVVGEGEEDQALVADELSFLDAVGVLAEYSLVNSMEDTGRFSIHAVVHEWSLYNIADDETRERLCVRAMRMVAASVPPSSVAIGLQAAQRLLSHARLAARRHIKMEPVTGSGESVHASAWRV
ncbi:hypothetical protein MBLNU13_g11326t2 [Cladosporium sp. NU13]